MKQIIVNENQAGQRLDKLLLKILNKAPKSFIYKMLRKKSIVLNGKKAEGSEMVRVEDEIRLYLSEETIGKFSGRPDVAIADYELDIIYEDKNILIINKPAGLLSQRATKNDRSMVDYVISYMLSTRQLSEEDLQSFKPGICNRLDRNTSGLLIAGKTLIGLQEMSRIIRERKVNKYYLCIVKGKLSGKKEITGYLTKDNKSNKVNISLRQAENSDYIATQYEPLTSDNEYTLLEVKLITGKSHQIRAHLASIGHPIIGDAKYGDRTINNYFEKKFGLKSQLLHSYRYIFPQLLGPLDSLSGKELIAPEPEMFSKIKDSLFYKSNK
jgi:23S rRNA pseudouridine955/2504/2580 synthase